MLAVADASGRYVPSFFWGNSYWTGSESLCYHLNTNASKLEAPPFRLGFYTVRLQIALPQYISPSVSITAEQDASEVFFILFLADFLSFLIFIAEFATRSYALPCPPVCPHVTSRASQSGISSNMVLGT